MRKTLFQLLLTITLTFTIGSAWAADIVPHTFASGNQAYAESVNQNFSALENAMPGVAYISTTESGFALAVQAAYSTTLELNAPSNGFAVVVAFGTGQCTSTNANLNISLSDETNSIKSTNWNHGREHNLYQAYHISHVFPVTAGVTEFRIQSSCSSGIGTLTHSAFYAMFFPLRY